MINSDTFKVAHRRDEKACSRQRIFSVSLWVMIMLRKSIKSWPLMLNDISALLSLDTLVSHAAYGKARQKLKASAFVELNRQAVVEVMYADHDDRQWQGFRVLANDGSHVR